MVFPVFVVPLIVWGTVTIIGIATAVTLKAREKRKRRQTANPYGGDAWTQEPHPWIPSETQSDTAEPDAQVQSHSVRGRRPTPYPLFVPSISDEECESESDETIFVMHDAVEGLPISSDIELPRSMSTGALPLGAGAPGSAGAQMLESRRRSSSSMEDPVSTMFPDPMPQADSDAITLASRSARARLSQRLRRKVRPSVRFTQDSDVPDYREVLRSRRRSSMSNLKLSTTALFGSPIGGRSPAESTNLAEIAEDDRVERSSGSMSIA